MHSKESSNNARSQLEKMRIDREVEKGNLIQFGSKHAIYDEDLYSDSNDKNKYYSYIPTEDEDIDEINPVNKSLEHGSWREAAAAMNNPELFKQELASRGREIDPLKSRAPKTVQDREGSYRSKWRERRISPPRCDPFSSDGNSAGRTYKEIMKETYLEKERKV